MKRIVILSNNYKGLVCFRKEVLEAFRSRGYDILVFAPFDDKAEEIRSVGCSVFDMPFNRKGKNPFADVLLFFWYIKYLKVIKPDVVLSYTIKPNVYGGIACRMLNIPQIANITGLGTAVENSGWLQKLTIFLYKVGLKNTKVVFFQNRANLQFCEKYKMVKGHRRLIPGSGVNLQYHAYHDYPTESPLKFIFIGRLLKEKGIEEFLGMSKKIKREYPSVEFHIVGACEDAYDEAVKVLQKEGIVVYHGLQPDVRPFIAMCHCIVHPSFYPEGMSNVLLESCAAGRPIITTGRPGCGEIVDDNVNGFLVKERSTIDLVDKVEKFIHLPFERKLQMGVEARNKVVREFDREIVVQAYIQEIERIYNV